MTLSDRLRRYQTVARALSALSDGRLAEHLEASAPIGSGLGGSTRLLDVDGVRVFVKRVALCEIERRHELSTANLFEVPSYCHYGVGSPGSPGFGAWRELTAHALTTQAVLAQQAEGFPLLYHWRVLLGRPVPCAETADIEYVSVYWNSPNVRQRLAALAGAVASLVLFIEHVPETLFHWLERHRDDSGWVGPRLMAVVADMNRLGLWHFDAHFENILTDGQALYLSDFGLAGRPDWDEAERAFLDANRTHDLCHVVTHWVNWLVVTFGGFDRSDYAGRNACIARVAAGAAVDLPPVAAGPVRHLARIAAPFNEFCRAFRLDSRATRYPRATLEAACAEALPEAGLLP